MNIEIDTHTHTLASGHAYSSIREMAAMAASKGLKALAITEHGPQMPGTCHLTYFQNLRFVPRQLEGIEMLFGVELNILNEDGQVDLSQKILKEMDIAIASMHTSCYRGEQVREKITRAYLRVMDNELVDIIGHPDDGRYPVDFELLAREAKRTGTLLEVNNSSLRPEGFRVNTRENCLRMLEACKKHEAMVVMGTDAHVDTDIGGYRYAGQVLKEVNFPEELVANTSFEKLKTCLKRIKKV